MTKKATTIVLIIVVLFLIASTVYVSIILTTDSGTTPRPSRASEIEGATPAAIDATDPLAETDTGIDPLAELEEPTSELPLDNEDVLVTPEITEDPADLLAYANPTPTGATAGPANGTPSPTTTSLRVSPTAVVTAADLPETGKGQTATKSATATSTVIPTQQQQALPQSMPVAGSITGPIIAFVVAGATIVVSFFL